jgi:hypothetical protein
MGKGRDCDDGLHCPRNQEEREGERDVVMDDSEHGEYGLDDGLEVMSRYLIQAPERIGALSVATQNLVAMTWRIT